MLSFVFNKHTHPSNDVTNCAESAIYVSHIFVDNLATKKRYCSFKYNKNFRVIGTLTNWVFFILLINVNKVKDKASIQLTLKITKSSVNFKLNHT